MTHPHRGLLLGLLLASGRAGSAQVAGPPGRVEILETADDRRVEGTLVGDAATGLRFQPKAGGRPVPIGPGMVVVADPSRGRGPASPPAFRVLFGDGQRISGRFDSLDDRAARIAEGPGGRPVECDRRGVLAVVQRPGESAVLLDQFDAIDPGRWSVTGDPDVGDEAEPPRSRTLRMPAAGASMTSRLAESIPAGQFGVSYYDDGARSAGRRSFVDLSFRGPAGDLSTVRVVLGRVEETLGVESPDGPAMAVQPLPRRPGWHLLSIRFDPGRLDLAVDRLELAHGDGPPGPLAEVRLATEVVGRGRAADAPDARFDDLRLMRSTAPSGRLQVDPAQDEVRLATGDQVFGSIRAVGPAGVRVAVEGGEPEIPWPQVSGLHLRRDRAVGAATEGVLARVEWAASGPADPGDLDAMEGALTAASESALSLATPFAGVLTIPRDRVARVEVRGRGRRVVLDPKPRHLGDRVVDDLDPPQPEDGPYVLPFDLARPPEGPAILQLDVVQLVSALGNHDQRVAPGELSTHLVVNDREIDTLNRHVSARNEAPERVAIRVPPGVLKAGRNVLALRQDGTKDEPAKRDNFGLLGVALELPGAPGANAAVGP